jgi:hypothetical protein
MLTSPPFLVVSTERQGQQQQYLHRREAHQNLRLNHDRFFCFFDLIILDPILVHK